MSRPIVFASDYGAGTEWVGVCHSVIESIAPGATVIDLVHTLPRLEPGLAGLVLREAMPYVPVCVAVLVVDPGVGTERRSVALLSGRGDVLVGPDNGLLPRAAERIGRVAAARSIDLALLHAAPSSSTFHGRDIFSPIAARLAVGFPFEDLGPSIEVETLARAPSLLLEVTAGKIACEAIDVDTFGNVRLSARSESLAAAGLDHSSAVLVLSPSGERTAMRATAFGDIEPGRLALMVDSFGWLSLCLREDNAASRLGIDRHAHIELHKM